MHILVIGGCGFIGSHIVDELILSGHIVSVLDHGNEQFRPPHDNVIYYHRDILSPGILNKAINTVDAVVHAASSTVPASSSLDPHVDVESNLIGMIRLLECMRQAGKNRIIFLSSGGTVYGKPTILPVPEDHHLNPQCSYAVVKIAMEHYVNIYANLHGFKATIIRPANPYGPRQSLSGIQGVIASFTEKVLRNEPLPLIGTGDVIRDFFHVKDLAKFCSIVINSGKTGIFNAGSGHGTSILEIIQILEDIHTSPVTIRQMDSRAFDIPAVVMDIQKARQELDWQPKISLHEGMTDYYHWLKTFMTSHSMLQS
jgi:UDP-glucose 4-epimerase